MELLSIAKEMERAIKALGEEGKRSVNLIETKARAMADYDKELGIRIGALRAAGLPIGVIDKTAKGDASEYLYRKIVAEEGLKAHYSRMEQLEAQLNGLQSIFRHLEHLPENK